MHSAVALFLKANMPLTKLYALLAHYVEDSQNSAEAKSERLLFAQGTSARVTRHTTSAIATISRAYILARSLYTAIGRSAMPPVLEKARPGVSPHAVKLMHAQANLMNRYEVKLLKQEVNEEARCQLCQTVGTDTNGIAATQLVCDSCTSVTCLSCTGLTDMPEDDKPWYCSPDCEAKATDPGALAQELMERSFSVSYIPPEPLGAGSGTGGGGGVGSAGGGGSGGGGRDDNWRVYCEGGEANELGIICETDCVEKHSHICTFSSCSCQFPKHWGLPCRHLFALYQKVRGREARARMRLCLRASVACTAPVHDVRDKHERAEPRSHCTTPHACEVDCCALDR